jgi:hypothetical protein
MKLRFRSNSLRLRVNQREVKELAAGVELAESVDFGTATLSYVLTPVANAKGTADFDGKQICVKAALADWANGEEIGFYFVAGHGLKVAIEKDLECSDAPEEEKDPEAFPRAVKSC